MTTYQNGPTDTQTTRPHKGFYPYYKKVEALNKYHVNKSESFKSLTIMDIHVFIHESTMIVYYIILDDSMKSTMEKLTEE